MQRTLMRKRLRRLTHTNIHISPEEEGPRGPRAAICVETGDTHTNRQKNAPPEQEKDSRVKDCGSRWGGGQVWGSEGALSRDAAGK